MASRPIGSKILEVNTDSVRLIIKGKSALSLPDSIAPDQKISNIEIVGNGVNDITVCGEAIPSDKGLSSVQSIAVIPVFFEQTDYQFSVKSVDGSDVSVWHENRNIREKFDSNYGPDDVSGIINFGNSVGYSDFEISTGGVKRLVVRVEVYPSKISYKEDYRKMMSEISDEVYAIAIDFLRKTYQNMRIGDLELTTPAMFFKIIETIFEDLKKAINRIVSAPHHELQVEHVILPYYKAKKTDSKSEKWILKHPEFVLRNGSQISVEKTSSVRKFVTYNTTENQFTKFILQRTIKRLADFKARYQITATDSVETAVIDSVNAMTKTLQSILGGSFLKDVDDYKATRSMSLVFEMAPGYRELFKYYLILQRGLEINGDVFRISMKDTAILYEYWCFIKLVRLLKDKQYKLASPDVIKVDNSGITVSLVKGKKSEVKFVNPRTGEQITLAYNPSEYNTQTVPQRPDNVLTLTKNGSGVPYQYVFDAKYRIESNPDERYPQNDDGSKTPGPKLDDINTMHRYRDSIVYENTKPSKFTFEKTMFGAYILFPYGHKETDGSNPEEDLYKNHRFYKSIESVNIGGLPFLPGTTKLVEKFLSELIADSEESAFERASLPRGIDQKLSKVDWRINDVVIGSRASDEQLQFCLRNNYYYLPSCQVKEECLPFKYVAIYEGGIGIRYYGEIIRATRTKRKNIPFPAKHGKPDDVYYVFTVREWLEKDIPIKYCDEYVREARYSNAFLLENCTQTYELFNIHSEEQYRLLYELKNVFSDTTVFELDKDPNFKIDDNHSIWAHEGYFNLLNKDGEILAQIPIDSFKNKPGIGFRRILGIVGRDGGAAE